MRWAWLLLGVTFGIAFFFVPALAQSDYTFDLAEIEKEPYSLGGFLEFKPSLFILDRDAAFYRLKFYDRNEGKVSEQFDFRLRPEGSLQKGMVSAFARIDALLRYDYEVAWLWARLREQTIFFPWHDRRLDARMDFAVPAADGLQRNVREFLLAAEHYSVAYRAAFEYSAGPVLPQLRVPTLITAAALDPLAPHLDRIGDRADCVKIEVSADGATAIDKAFAQLLACPGDPAPPAGCPRGGQRRLAGHPERRRRVAAACPAGPGDRGPGAARCGWLCLHDPRSRRRIGRHGGHGFTRAWRVRALSRGG